MADCSLGAKHAVSPLNHIQIDFHDAPFGHYIFQHQGDERFLYFAPGSFLAGKKQIFCELLADGGAARHQPALFQVFLVGFLDGFEVKALMLQKLAVLRSDDRPL